MTGRHVRPTGGVEVVVVDYGGVLTNPLAHTFAAFAARMGVELGELGAAFLKTAAALGENPMAALETGRISEAQLVDRVLQHLPPGAGERLGGRPFGEVWFEGRLPNEPFVAFLRDLRAGGQRLALLTNNVREWEQRWRAQLPVEELFEVVVNSAHEGVRKPDPVIFERLLDRLGVRADQCLFVDDDETNCAAARALGFTVVRFDDTEQAVADVRGTLERAVAA